MQEPAGYSSDEEGAAAPLDAAFIAGGRRGIRVMPGVMTTHAVGAVTKQRTIHVNFRNESIQVYGGSVVKNYYCKDLIYVRWVAQDTIYFETKSSRMLNPKVFKFPVKSEARMFVAYVKSIVDYGQVIWDSFDELDFSKSGQITAVDLRESFLANDVPVDGEAIERIMALAPAATGRFEFTDFVDALADRCVYSLRDCLLELMFNVEETSERTMRCTVGTGQQFSATPNTPNTPNTPTTPTAVASTAAAPTAATATAVAVAIASVAGSDDRKPSADSHVSTVSDANVDANAVISFEETEGTSPAPSAPPASQADEPPRMMPGEVVFINVSCVRWVLCGDERSPTRSGLGHMAITNYRIILTPSRRGLTSHKDSRHYRPPFFDYFTIPLQCVLRVSLSPRPQTILQNAMLEIHTKDSRVLKLTSLKTNYDTFPALEEMYSALRKSSNVDKITRLFCFRYEAVFPMDGWLYSDVRLDYNRMELTEDPDWQLIDNQLGQICKSYPSYIVVPASLTLAQIIDSGAHRAQARLPAVCYRHKDTQAIIVRSSQPRTGLGDTVCASDVALLDAYRRSGAFNSSRSEIYSVI
jgi:hypothetical protein